jgi:hypothetical protein
VQPLRSLARDIRSGDSYALVLTLILASLVAGIVAPERTWARIVGDCLFAATVVIAYWTATARRAFLVPRVILPSAALALVVVGAAEGATTEVTSSVIGAALAVATAVLITRDLLDRRRVDVQTVLGALVLYVLLGFLFAFSFELVGEIGGGPFFSNGDDGTTSDYLYFSLVALSTTGFGDLSPAERAGRALAVLEIVVGQLYLVTVVAVIVTAAMGRQLLDGARRRGSGSD